jgi:hypothetical protein
MRLQILNMEVYMTLVVSTLFIAALVLATFSMSITVIKAMPRIQQVIENRQGFECAPRVVRIGYSNAIRYRNSTSQRNVVHFKRHIKTGPFAKPVLPFKIAA